MSRVEELIERLCPNGVEYKKLNTIANIYDGTHQTPNYKTSGVKFVSVENIDNLYDTNKYISYEDYELYKIKPQVNDILMTRIGTIGKCTVIEKDEKLAYYVSLALIRPNNKYINSTFLKYYIESIYGRKELRKRTLINAVPIKVNMGDIGKISVAVPPLEVQCEIVHILDNFTLLSAELSAELKARQQQYEYYNYNLLKFEDAPYYSLEELCDIVDYRGKTPKKTNEGVFLVTAKNIRKGFIDYEKSQEFIDKEDYAEVMRRGLPKIGDVLITTEAPCGNVAQVDNEDIALAQRVIKYRPKDERLDSTFLKYILLGEEFQNKLISKATGGTVKGIKGSILHKLTIPLPTIEEQRKVVKILDRFDKLCNDISDGLPAEINARQKQYEYYREKLLTFKMIGEK